MKPIKNKKHKDPRYFLHEATDAEERANSTAWKVYCAGRGGDPSVHGVPKPDDYDEWDCVEQSETEKVGGRKGEGAVGRVNETYDHDARQAIQITKNQADIQMLKQAIESLGGKVYLTDE